MSVEEEKVPAEVDPAATPSPSRGGGFAKWFGDRVVSGLNFVLDGTPTLGSLLVLGGAVAFTFFYMVSLPGWDQVDAKRRPIYSGVTALAYAAVVLLPFLINTGLALMIRRSTERGVGKVPLPPIPSRVDEVVGPDAVRAATEEWDYHFKLTTTTSERTLHYSMIYGTLVGVAATIILYVGGETLVFGARATPPLSAARVDAAYAAGAGVVVTVLRDIGRLVVRTAQRDGNASVFAHSLRRVIMVTVTILGLVALAQLSGGKSLAEMSRQTWVCVGIAVAIVGDRALDVVSDRLATWLGAGPPKKVESSNLELLEGITADDIVRLQEAQIATLHALAAQALPRLFFQLPFSFRQLLEWQDQALLLDRLGPIRGAHLRDQAMIRRVSELWDEGDRYLRANSETAPTHLGFASTEEARSFFQRLVQDGAVTRLVIYRAAFCPPAAPVSPAPAPAPANPQEK